MYVAAILVHKLALLCFLATRLDMANLSSMTKSDMILVLRTYGEEPPTAWTRVDLRHRIDELVEGKEIEIQTGKKASTALQKATTELNKASRKKSELIHHAQTNLLLSVPPNATISGIQKAAMEKLLTEIPGEDGDLMGYGKFSSRTYLDVKENEPKYCEWTKAISKEETTSTYMKRFVDYLTQPEETEKKRAPIKVHTTKDTAKKGYKTEVVEREETHTPRPTSTASSSTEATVNQLTELVGTLIAEVKELKEERSMAAPRKIVATSDVKMDTSHKDSR